MNVSGEPYLFCTIFILLLYLILVYQTSFHVYTLSINSITWIQLADVY